MNIIAKYQKAYKEIVNQFTSNKQVTGVFIMGSMVTGDLWEGSDIDLLVTYSGDFNEVRDVYTEVLEVPIHVKIISEKEFLDKYKSKNSVTTLLSSKLVYSKNIKIEKAYDEVKYLISSGVNRWNLVYLANVLKLSSICKKYIAGGSITTAYEILIRVICEYSKLVLNMNKYVVSKDSISMACNLDDNFNTLINNLFQEKATLENINYVVNDIDKYIKANIVEMSEELFKFLKDHDKKYSSFELSKDEYFKEFNINFEYILKYLNELGLLNKELKDIVDSNGNKITVEKVYSIIN